MKYEKKYLSRAMTRAMASQGMPIGDPTGGPAYGERLDPVSAVMAVASMWEAGTIIAGAATIGAGIEALTVAQGLMFAGGALSLVGNVTGNKNLMVLGGAVALGGGIGGLMSDAGAGFNQTFSDAFSSTSSAPTANLASNPAATNSAVGSQAVGTQAPASDLLKDNISSTAAVEAVAVSNPASQLPNNPTPSTPDILAPASPQPIGGYDSTAVQFNPAQQATNLQAPPANTFGQSPSSSQITPGIIDKAMAFAKEQPMAAMVLGQAAGGVATGVMDMASGKTAAQTEQLKADAAYRNSIADKTSRDTALQASRIAQINANLKAQYPQLNVNQSAVTMGQQQPTGLVAGARG